MFATFRNTAIAALGLCAGLVVPAQAAYVVTLQQVGANVVATGSGTIDLAGLTLVGVGLDGGSMVPGHGVIFTGPPASQVTDFYVAVTGPTSFGSGGGVAVSSGSGDFVGIDGAVHKLGVLQDYTSGSPLSDTATYDTQTLSSLGVTPGTYVWTWGTGANADSFTLQIGPVPEPASLPLLVMGLAGLGLVVRTRRA